MLPEEKHANLILKKYSEFPPVDILKLIKIYSELIIKSIPINGIDGVSLDIKVPDRKAKVILNADISQTRQRFTLAHELGHIIIPWHIGDIIADRISDGEKSYQNPYDYQIMEGEANRFAAELLMPENWILSEFKKNNDLAKLHEKVTNLADVSAMAACIKIVHSLPIPVAYCTTNSFGFVTGSFGQSKNAQISRPKKGTKLNLTHFDKFGIHSKFIHKVETYNWWLFGTKFNLPTSKNTKDWKTVLNEIITDLDLEGSKKITMSLSGVIGAVNSTYKRSPSPTLTGLVEACLKKMDRPIFKDLIKHKEFDIFLTKRCTEIISKY